MAKKFGRDLSSVKLENLDWSPEKRAESVEKVFRYVAGHAEEAMRWYLSKKNAKRRWARFLRVWAIIFTALAGLLPVLSQIYKNGNKVPIDPAWSTVLLLVAVTFVGLDHFFGFSNSWMRFISAELQIKTKYEAFQLDWQTKQVDLQGQTPSVEQAVELLNLCRSFLNTVNAIIVNEMEEWKRDFKAALKKIDAETKNVRKI